MMQCRKKCFKCRTTQFLAGTWDSGFLCGLRIRVLESISSSLVMDCYFNVWICYDSRTQWVSWNDTFSLLNRSYRTDWTTKMNIYWCYIPSRLELCTVSCHQTLLGTTVRLSPYKVTCSIKTLSKAIKDKEADFPMENKSAWCALGRYFLCGISVHTKLRNCALRLT